MASRTMLESLGLGTPLAALGVVLDRRRVNRHVLLNRRREKYPYSTWPVANIYGGKKTHQLLGFGSPGPTGEVTAVDLTLVQAGRTVDVNGSSHDEFWSFLAFDWTAQIRGYIVEANSVLVTVTSRHTVMQSEFDISCHTGQELAVVEFRPFNCTFAAGWIPRKLTMVDWLELYPYSTAELPESLL